VEGKGGHWCVPAFVVAVADVDRGSSRTPLYKSVAARPAQGRSSMSPLSPPYPTTSLPWVNFGRNLVVVSKFKVSPRRFVRDSFPPSNSLDARQADTHRYVSGLKKEDDSTHHAT